MSKYFHTWNVILDPVLPAREVVVAYLNECGFSMFEPHEKGVLVYGGVEEVNEKEAAKYPFKQELIPTTDAYLEDGTVVDW